ncbi:MAG: DUF3784 domain-containing protein [Clostridia bacterium]|nr:DUF3784 domain-containing protein [Clostridia bacterium]
MAEFIITGVIGGLIIVLAIVLLTGRGSFLLAGFNTMSKDQKAKYDAQALSKFMGKILLPISILTPFTAIESMISWFPWVFFAITMGLCIFAVIYVNAGSRFRK